MDSERDGLVWMITEKKWNWKLAGDEKISKAAMTRLLKDWTGLTSINSIRGICFDPRTLTDHQMSNLRNSTWMNSLKEHHSPE